MSKSVHQRTLDGYEELASVLVDEFIAKVGLSFNTSASVMETISAFMLDGEDGDVYQRATPEQRTALKRARRDLARIGLSVVMQILLTKNKDWLDQAELETTGSIGRSLDERG